MSLEIGEVVDGKYRVVRLIGEGGMGAVYEGENVRIRRRVAIKVLHPSFTANQEAVQRFEREAQAAGRIGNDHILEVLDLGTLSSSETFMVMEYLDGETLSERIKRQGRLSAGELAPIATQILTGLSAAHDAGIIHRDLKPDNIFILREKAGRKDFVKIIDFGVSKFSPLSGDGLKMTRTGTLMGTPYYMSPEQASGSAEADRRSDVYSVGVMLYEAATGKVPFEGDTFNQLMFKIVLADVPEPLALAPDLDPAFASIIQKAMAKDVAARFQSCEELQQAIERWQRSGAAVTVPPEGGASAHIPPEALRASQVSSPNFSQRDARRSFSQHEARESGVSGAESWSSSQLKLPKKRSARLVLGGLAMLLVCIAAVAFYVTRNTGSELATSPPTAPSARAAEVKATAAARTVTHQPEVTPVEDPSPEEDIPSAGPTAPSATDPKPGSTPDGDASSDQAKTAAKTTTGQPVAKATPKATGRNTARTERRSKRAAVSGRANTSTKSKPPVTTSKPSTSKPSGGIDFGY